MPGDIAGDRLSRMNAERRKAMTDDNFKKYGDPKRTDYARGLEQEIAPDVWNRLGGNGSLRINIDTDVLWVYGDWNPYGPTKDGEYDVGKDAQNWVSYMVLSTINRLIDRGDLKVPED